MSSFRDKIRDDLKADEGCIQHMYLDTRGYVTVGVGHLVRNSEAAKKLRFICRDSGADATPEQIESDYRSVKRQPPAKVASFYKAATALDLPMTEIEALLNQQIDEFEAGIRARLQKYDQFPDDARKALLDMAFNLGIQGLFKKFPKLIAFAEQEDWEGCAKECRRIGISDARNLATKTMFENASRLA